MTDGDKRGVELDWRRMMACGGTIDGFILARTGTNFLQLGPCVAGSADAARALIASSLAVAGQTPVCADAPLAS